MARIKDTSVEEVKQRADIVDVVGTRVALRKVGGDRFSGRCPFHEERTPSFSVSAGKGFYHCFGCGAGGDAVRFVRESEGLDFVEAIEWLADRYRIALEYEETAPGQEQARRTREKQRALLEQTTAYFERTLWSSGAGASVREYLTGRGIEEATAREFRLGLSPGHGLAAKVRERGFELSDLKATGLVNARGNDYFPFRLMFPLADARGRILGFQARKLREDDPLRGKYVNSPESDLFKKSNVLYGLHLARPAIAKENRALVVEGNMDVIALRQAGVLPVVASMGTALTEAQLRELARLTKRIYLCFDADAAGEEATLRGMELAQRQGFDVRVVTLLAGKDAADDPQGFLARIPEAASYVLHRVRLELDRTPDRQEAFIRSREILERAEDSPERQEALRLVADRLELPRETLTSLRAAGGRTAPNTDGAGVTSRLIDAGRRLERDALAAGLAHAEVAAGLAGLPGDHFDDPSYRAFHEAIQTGGAPDVQLHAELDAIAGSEEIDERTGRELVFRLRERSLRRALESARLSGDLKGLTEHQHQLSRLLKALDELR